MCVSDRPTDRIGIDIIEPYYVHNCLSSEQEGKEGRSGGVDRVELWWKHAV